MSSLAVPNANGNLFEIKTMQSSVIRTLVEALKEILTEANLEFDSNGIKIIAMDETHTVLVYLQLLAERFVQGGGEYYCPSKHVLGINMIYLFKLIRTMGNNDTLTLYLPANNPNKLGIRMENSETATTTNYFLKIFDTNVDEIQIPSLTFTSIITMSSSEFQKQCRDMKGLGDDVEKVEITSTGGE
jgi:proliferating cell nuclear antigen